MNILHCLVGATLLATSWSLSVPKNHRVVDEYHGKPTKGAEPIPGEDMAYWKQDAQEALKQQLEIVNKVQQAKNVIFFLGDGMSISTVTAARTMKGSITGNWEREKLVWEQFPYAALSKTYTTDYQVADSACSATAYLCGVKANKGTIGVDSNVLLSDCASQQNTAYHTPSIAKWFQDAGRSSGIVTTTRITHATPAGTYAHVANRDWENDSEIVLEGQDPDTCDDVAEQLIYGETGKNFKVILGGGRKHLLPNDIADLEEGVTGLRTDGKDLITLWQEQKTSEGATASYVWNRDQLLGVDVGTTDYLMGLFAYNHMDYVLDRDVQMDPSLPEMTRVAIEMLQKDPNGYFLLVEGGRIDHAHHDNTANKALTETVELDEAISLALNLTDAEDTLILVTADHGHSLTFNGYPARHNDIIGIAGVSDIDGIPFTTLLYGNGPGFKITGDCSRPDPAASDFTDKDYAQTSSVPLDFSHHDGSDVGIWTHGPHSHLFTGVYEQNYIPHALAYAACVGDGLIFCDAQKGFNHE